MTGLLDIAAVRRATGLTARALRFYEARGLIRPLRTASGRRAYGAEEVARLGRVVALKAAGFSLADIGRLLDRAPVDLRAMIEAQLAALDARTAELDAARRVLTLAKSRVDRGEPLDAAMLCSLIRTGDQVMTHENWRAVADPYMSEDARRDFAATAYPDGFDQAAYSAKWADLAGRVEAALPMDPASAQARAFKAEWVALLQPFTATATPAMMAGVEGMYDRIDDWRGEQTPPFSAAVWAFIGSVR